MNYFVLSALLFSKLAFGQEFDPGKAEQARLYEKQMLEQLALASPPLQLDSSLDYLGRWGWGACAGVATMGNYVFTGSGPTLLWLDMSDKQNPVIVWETLTNGPLSNFIIRDSIGYALFSSSNLLIVDFRNPLAPVIRAELPIISGLLSLAVGDSLAFVKRYSGFLYCIDISNPSSPFLRATIQGTSAQWGKLAIVDHNLYLGDQNGFTEHVDVSNPDSARVTMLFNVAFTVTAIYARDTLLLLGNGGTRLYIYSTVIPDSPVQLSNASIGIAGITSITLRGDTAFVGTIDGHLVSVDIIDRLNPVILGSYAPPVFQPELSARSIAAQDTSLYCSFGNGVTTYSVANPASMTVLSFFPTGYQSNKVIVKNRVAYVTSGYGGLWVVDISDPVNPIRIGNLQTTGYAYHIVIDSTIGYMSLNHPLYLRNQDAPNEVWVLDVSRLESLNVLDTYLMDSPFALSKSGGLLFVTQANNIGPPLDTTLAVFNVSNPSNIRLISRTVAGNVREITGRDSIAFVASASGFGSPNPGLNIFDCRDPANVQLLSTALTSAQGISINDDLAFVHRGDSTFVVDVTDLAAPSILSRVRHPSPSYSGPWESVATGDAVFWANGGEFGVIDVSNSSEPRNLFEVEIFGQGGIDVVGDTIYVTRADGVWIYKFNRGSTSVGGETGLVPDAANLFPNYPNPFNPGTTISYEVAARGHVTLRVYNLLGEEVLDLVNGIVEPGSHTAQVDASDLASGVYFYRLGTERGAITRKMVLIR